MGNVENGMDRSHEVGKMEHEGVGSDLCNDGIRSKILL